MHETELLKKIKLNRENALEEVYLKHRKDFFKYASGFSIHQEDIADIYQDSIIVLYDNIISGQLKELTSSLKTYLFSIGKYKILNFIKLKNRNQSFTDDSLIECLPSHDEHINEEQISLFINAYQLLGPKCQKILRLFYYEGLSLNEIKKFMTYSSTDVVKSQKSRCIKQIKDLIKDSK